MGRNPPLLVLFWGLGAAGGLGFDGVTFGKGGGGSKPRRKVHVIRVGRAALLNDGVCMLCMPALILWWAPEALAGG